MNRRNTIKALGLGAISATTILEACNTNPAKAPLTDHAVDTTGRQDFEVARDRSIAAQTFFDAHEMATIVILADIIIPKDQHSGSATDAGVPEFMDFMMIDQPRRQIAMRGGLAMIDRLAIERFGKRFVSGSDRERRSLLDEITYTTNPDRGLTQAIAFFNSFRDLTASGFWSTKMGVADLQYQGNVFVSEWNGCPDAALKKLGVAQA